MSDSLKKIGQVLAAARKEQNKSLQDVSVATKIIEKYLRAIEEGSAQELPSLAYFALFARNYAQDLGLDPGVIDELLDTDITSPTSNKITGYDNSATKESTQSKTEEQAKKFGKSIIWIIIVIVLAFAFVLSYIFIFSDSDDQGTLTDYTPAANNQTPTTEIETFANNNNQMDITPYVPPEPLQFRMRALQDVWTLVLCDGDTVLNRELKAGEIRKWEAKYRYKITLGISTAVEMSINGQRLGPFGNAPRIISNLEINQVNYTDFLLKEPEVTREPTITDIETAQPQINDGTTDSLKTNAVGTTDGD